MPNKIIEKVLKRDKKTGKLMVDLSLLAIFFRVFTVLTLLMKNRLNG
jgi:uncharacterized protein with PhoU and TrkA domain